MVNKNMTTSELQEMLQYLAALELERGLDAVEKELVCKVASLVDRLLKS